MIYFIIPLLGEVAHTHTRIFISLLGWFCECQKIQRWLGTGHNAAAASNFETYTLLSHAQSTRSAQSAKIGRKKRGSARIMGKNST